VSVALAIPLVMVAGLVALIVGLIVVRNRRDP
jgi:hypothetical protein